MKIFFSSNHHKLQRFFSDRPSGFCDDVNNDQQFQATNFQVKSQQKDMTKRARRRTNKKRKNKEKREKIKKREENFFVSHGMRRLNETSE